MERADFELVVAVARTGSLTAAARQLHVAQPALSRRLQHLERAVGAPLFDRGRHGAVATVVGRTLVERAEAALEAMARAEQDVADVAAGRAGRLRVGTNPTLGAALLPAALASFRHHHPDVRFELTSTGDSNALQQQVAQHELDVALTVTTPLDPGVRVATAGEQRLVVVAPTDRKLGRNGRVPRSALVGLPIVVPGPGEGLRVVVEALFAENGTLPVIAIETNEREMLIPLVAAGLGVTVLPEEFALPRAVEGLECLPLEPGYRRPVGAVVASGAMPLVVKAFVDALATTWPPSLTPVRRARARRTPR